MSVRLLGVLLVALLLVGGWIGRRGPTRTEPAADTQDSRAPESRLALSTPGAAHRNPDTVQPITPTRPGIFLDLPTLREGAPIQMPLPNGSTATGTVTLVQHDMGGWLRVAGALEGPSHGSFALSSDGSSIGGLLQFPSRRLAYQVTGDPIAGVVLRERPLGELVCLPLPRPDFESTPPSPLTRAAAQAPPLLSSRPEATAVLYLDFDGESVTDPLWNSGRRIDAKAPNLTTADITAIWRRVKEDFWPFDVDITTNLARYTNAPVGSRMRCIITPTDTAASGAGGVAYVDSFSQAGTNTFSSNIPCWVFNFSVNGIAEAISHELGHTLGLRHDGRTNPAQEYYGGHGGGAVGWAPIMGVSYYKSLSQWSKGEYLNANRTQDDVAIISGAVNGFGYVEDEAGDTLATAATLTVDDISVHQTGVITQASDTDLFVFRTLPGPVTIAADPAPLSPNLDIHFELLNAAGTPLVTNNPEVSLPAAINTTLPAGTYYLRIRGTGFGSPLTTGYSNYGSIGEYTLSGTFPGTPAPPKITSAGSAKGMVGLPFTYQIVANRMPTSYAVVGTLPGGLDFDTNTGLISGTPTESGTRDIAIEATNEIGTSSKALTLNILPSGAPLITSAPSANGTSGLGFSYQITTLHPAQTFGIIDTLPPGITLHPTTGLLSGTPTPTGEFSVTVTAENASGSDSATLTINLAIATLTLNEALDTPPRVFSATGGLPWQGQTAVTFDQLDAAQSSPVANNGVSVMQTTVAGPVTVSFRYRVDSEEASDFLHFQVDGTSYLDASGFVDWTSFTLPLPAGNHTLRWEYRKDASGHAGTDAAWIDLLGFTNISAPVITSAAFAPARTEVSFNYQIVANNSPTSFSLAGTLPAGLSFNATTGHISGVPEEGGVFTVTISASNIGGTGTRSLLISVESGPLDLVGALDQTDLVWVNTGTALWRGETDVTHDAVDAAAATSTGDGESAIMRTEVEGPASLRFFWKVSSEVDYDYLSFRIDGIEHSRISGEVDWQLKSFPIPAGLHHIEFCYHRNAFHLDRLNAAWVDEVSVFPREGLSGSDSFVGAPALTGPHVSIDTNNLDATLEPGETGPFGNSYGHSLWWTWTAPETGRVVASTAGSNFDTILGIYRGTSLTNLNFVAGNDDASRFVSTSRAMFNAVAGQTYFITIGGFGGASGFIDFDIRYADRGSYVGIIAPDSGADETSGFIQFTLNDALAYTGKVTFDGRRHALRGSLASGEETRLITRKGGLPPLEVTLTTDLASGENTVTGTMKVAERSYHFTARRRLNAGGLSELAPGSYTFLLEPATAGTSIAYGAGYGRARVTARGDVRFSGALGDGRRVSQGGALTFGNLWPCFLAPYRRGIGTIAGEILFDAVADNPFTGALRWRLEDPVQGIFSEDVALTGSRYFRPTDTAPALFTEDRPGDVQLTLSHRDAVLDPADALIQFDAPNRFTALPPGGALTLNSKTGLFTGRFLAPVNGARQKFRGALLQSENRGAGLFKAFIGHGRVDLVPVP